MYQFRLTDTPLVPQYFKNTNNYHLLHVVTADRVEVEGEQAAHFLPDYSMITAVEHSEDLFSL